MAEAIAVSREDPPLVVDLDGTLLHSDLLMETGLLFLRDQPLRFLQPVQWLLQGKAVLKQELAGATRIDVSVLPYDLEVIKLIEQERGRGRRVVLATASHRALADDVAAHLKLFDEVIATDAQRNLSATHKRDALVQSYGERGFDYAGNSSQDLPVWAAARRALVVNASQALERRARRIADVQTVLRRDRSPLKDWTKALRVHQWLKNLLVFIPVLAAHRHLDASVMLTVLSAFACFCLCASSVYIFNDLLDLRDDRHHASKRARPFAAGRLSIGSGLAACVLLVAVAAGLAAWRLPWQFDVGMAIYYGLTLAYSLSLKRRMVIDVVTLAGLYTLRIVVGAMALDIPLSFWLLAFSMFIFLSLALVKRYAELYQVRAHKRGERARGRGYYAEDLQMVASLGAAAGYMAVMVLALYINDAHTMELYHHPQYIWMACPLLLTWITRVWMLAHRGQMNEDPIVFAARDRISLTICLLVAVVFWAAL